MVWLGQMPSRIPFRCFCVHVPSLSIDIYKPMTASILVIRSTIAWQRRREGLLQKSVAIDIASCGNATVTNCIVQTGSISPKSAKMRDVL